MALISTVLIVGAVGVVRTENLVHAVFWLSLTLIGTAAAFVVMDAAFMAMIQLVLYTGGVITLMLFGVMLTQHSPDTDIPNPLQRQLPAGIFSGALLFTMLWAIWATPELATRPMVATGTAKAVGEVLLSKQLLAFEVLSMLLLAGMIGAIVLARRKDP